MPDASEQDVMMGKDADIPDENVEEQEEDVEGFAEKARKEWDDDDVRAQEEAPLKAGQGIPVDDPSKVISLLEDGEWLNIEHGRTVVEGSGGSQWLGQIQQHSGTMKIRIVPVKQVL